MSERIRQRATALAWFRGCVQDNPCWPDCYDAALDAVTDDDMDPYEREHATVKQYRIYAGKRLGPGEDR